jgi:hypothetical protein
LNTNISSNINNNNNNAAIANSITLDPSALQQGYANVKMMNGNGSEKSENDPTKFNGGANGVMSAGNNSNNNGMIPKDKNVNQPFSIPLGYTENFKENHAEISC